MAGRDSGSVAPKTRWIEKMQDKNAASDAPNHRAARQRKLLTTFIGSTALAAVSAWLALALWHSMPQRTLTMAVYPEGTLNAELAKRYREILARHGVELKLRPSPGAVEILEEMRDPRSATSVAIIPGALTTPEESPHLLSLGSLYYMPLWIFTRRSHSHRRGLPLGHRIAVGVEGSSSRALTLRFLGQAGIIDRQTSLQSLAPKERAQALIDGRADMAVFLDSWKGPAVQQLLKRKDVVLEGIPRADALIALYPSLDKLTLPVGVVDMVEPRPPTDVVLVATKTSLIVRKELHPAIQYLLLEAALEIHSRPGIFHESARFPAPDVIDLPLSPHAVEFYKTGPPFLQRHLPFWLAVVLEEPLLWLIPMLAVLFPMLRFAPAVYEWLERRRIYKLYSELKRVEDEMSFTVAVGMRKNLLEQLDRLKERASRLSVPTPFSPLVYALKWHIEMVRQEAQRSYRRGPVASEQAKTAATLTTITQGQRRI